MNRRLYKYFLRFYRKAQLRLEVEISRWRNGARHVAPPK